jgi:archaellum biogenesis protein FlaJ (TadC family)
MRKVYDNTDYDFDEFEEQDDFVNYRQELKLEEKSRYKSHIFCLFVAIFILLFFSSFCLSKIDNIGEKMNLSFFNDKGEPNYLLLILQLLVLFLIIRMISKY